MEEYENCEHNSGSYFCFESGYQRCRSCDVIINTTKKEFYNDLWEN